MRYYSYKRDYIFACTKYTLSPLRERLQDVHVNTSLPFLGCTIEKAKVIVERYSTPRHLLQAYELLRSDVAREELLKDLAMDASGVSRVGRALSRDVWLLFHSPTYPAAPT